MGKNRRQARKKKSKKSRRMSFITRYPTMTADLLYVMYCRPGVTNQLGRSP